MAFTTAEAASIRLYLGYPTLFRYLDTRLEDAINLVGNDPDASTLARTLLTSIAGVETELGGRLTEVGLAKADEVAWFPGARANGTAGIDGVRSEGRRFSSQLSTLFGVPLWSDAWGEQGYRGDAWKGPDTQGGNGGFFPLG